MDHFHKNAFVIVKDLLIPKRLATLCPMCPDLDNSIQTKDNFGKILYLLCKFICNLRMIMTIMMGVLGFLCVDQTYLFFEETLLVVIRKIDILSKERFFVL